MKILILGATGMLGNAVGKHFLNTAHEVMLTYRTKNVVYGDLKKWIFFDALNKKQKLSSMVQEYNYIINCIGVIKPFMSVYPIVAREINTLFPWKLAEACKQTDTRLIHITTDCVFSGKEGRYIESSSHDALDDYGKSKSLGEPNEDSMVLRTSIIGEEIHKHASLIAWAKSQNGKTVKGFVNHWWNGVTTNRYALICEKIIDDNLYQAGLFHVHASDIVNKFEMMHFFNEKYQLNLTIEPVSTEIAIDRSLNSTQKLCEQLQIPTVKEMIAQL